MRLFYRVNAQLHWYTWVPTSWCANPMTMRRFADEVCYDVLLPEREPCFGDPR